MRQSNYGGKTRISNAGVSKPIGRVRVLPGPPPGRVRVAPRAPGRVRVVDGQVRLG